MTELNAMKENKVFDVVAEEDVPKGTKLLRSMLIFKTKRDNNGRVIKHKARWVAKGFSQKKGINYNETFAPTVPITAIRTMLSNACARGMNIQQMDVTTAFLNAELDHDIYMLPPRVEGMFPKNTVLKLKRSLYGLKQSPRLWNQTLDHWLRDQGLQPTQTDACVYTKKTPKGLLWVAVYVDDLLIFADDDGDMTAFKASISKRFKMKDLGEPSLCLGIKIVYNRKKRLLSLSQRHYLLNVLDNFGMSEAKHLGTPLSTGYVDKPADPDHPLPDVPFREVVGSLMYAATMTRPDIATAVSILCRHMKAYNMEHWTAAKHVLRYIKGTLDYNITYNGSEPSHNVAYSDASYGSDMATGRSRTGYVVISSGGPTAWNSRLQSTVAMASAESEYMALASTAQEVIFLRQLHEELFHHKLDEPTLVFTDNQPAMHVANRSITKMRHIRVRYHFVRQCVTEHAIVLRYCSTHDMVADLLTKILGKPKTQQFSMQLFN